MSSRIQVVYSGVDHAQIFAALSPKDQHLVFDLAMKHLVDDFLERYHLLVSMGCEITFPGSRTTTRKPVSRTEFPDEGGDPE